MKHIGALVMKFIFLAVILEVILLSTTALTFGNILAITLVITLLSYFIGDMGILPRSNNTTATLVDVGLALASLLLFNIIYPLGYIMFWDALFASVAIGIGEWLYHKFVARLVLPAER